MKEIGSEFWDVPLTNAHDVLLFPEQIKWYLSGRTALHAILDDISAKKRCYTAALPSWCCDSMIKPFINHGLDVQFYPVYRDGRGMLVQGIQDVVTCDIVLIMDYFGFHSEQEIVSEHGIVIRDLTHSLLCGIPDDVDYYFGSTRKLTGIWSGGYAWSKDGVLPEAKSVNERLPYIAARKAAMLQKKEYMEKSENTDKQFLKLFSYAEKWLDENEEMFGASSRDISVLKQMDTVLIQKKRRENAAYLLERIGQYAFVQKLHPDDCPLFVPVFFAPEIRNQLHAHLIKQHIYCPIHWPVTHYHKLTPETRRMYDEELSIPCDQRYALSDMQRICDEIISFVNSYKGERI